MDETKNGSPEQNAHTENIPFWRDIRVLRVLFQVLFLVGIVLLGALLYTNMRRGLDKLGVELALDFWQQDHFLQNEAGFDIAEGTSINDYSPSDSYLRAFWVGVVNTLKVSLIGVACATMLGLFVGITRLSKNWLVSNIAATYVECFRNIPLLLQILFWYAILRRLPNVRKSFEFFGGVFINQRGIYLPAPQPAPGLYLWFGFLLGGIILGLCLYIVRWRKLQQMELPGFRAKWALLAFLAVAILGFIYSIPFTLELPVLQRFNFEGGISLSPEFFALLIGLVIYTGAFIAEIVRAGIQAVAKGQREAAKAVGLNEAQVLRLIVLPQAIPIIVPPVTSQYLNLAKNSSLAIAVGFPDLFSIGETMMNQTGQSIPVFGMIMASYLIMSLTTSAAMNWYNRRLHINQTSQ